MAERSNNAKAPHKKTPSELDEYDFELPRELIAQEPTTNRADSRMMVINRHQGSGVAQRVEQVHLQTKRLYLWRTRLVVAG